VILLIALESIFGSGAGVDAIVADPQLPRDLPLDPWGHPYQYQLPGENGQPYTLRSFGKDGTPGGEDDAADIVFQ
jgi:general secretion pathway protein G